MGNVWAALGTAEFARIVALSLIVSFPPLPLPALSDCRVERHWQFADSPAADC